MTERLLLTLLVVALVLRAFALEAHEHPRGDVLLDVGVAQSLAEGEGFASGFERGVVRVKGGDTPLPPQGWADQHPPLWPLLASLPTRLGLTSSFGALKLLSWIASLMLLLMMLRAADRLLEDLSGAHGRLPLLGAALLGLSFVMIDGAGSGALYAVQAVLLLMLVEALAAARPSALRLGALLGALCLLNHQCLVLLPVPLLVLWLSPPARADAAKAEPSRGAALLVGARALAVALLIQLPWWWRNAELFGDPLFSVNGLYLLYRAGVPLEFAVEDGQPVLRFVETLGPARLPGVMLGNLRQNLPWLCGALIMSTGGLALAVLAGLPQLLRSAWTTRNRRLLALLLIFAVQVGVSLLWPAAKLRYLVPLTPLAILLALRVVARAPTRAQLLLGSSILLGAGALAVRHLLAGASAMGEGPWRGLCWLCATLLAALVFLYWTRARRSPCASLGVALGFAALLSVAPWIVRATVPDTAGIPTTAYHSHLLWPDVFGHPAELHFDATSRAVAEVADFLEEREARRVLGPRELLEPLGRSGARRAELIEWSGLPREWAEPALRAILAWPSAPDHVVLEGGGTAWATAMSLAAEGRLTALDAFEAGAGANDLVVFAVTPP